MTTFEYLAVLISIIVGLGITHLLGGVARFISNPGKYKLYWVHLVWTAYVFVYLAMFWWFQLWMNRVEEWTALLYMFLVVWTVLLYVQCAVIMPRDFPDNGDFRQYFYGRRKWFLGLLLADIVFESVDAIIKEHTDLLLGFAVMGIPLVIAITTKRPAVQAIVAVFGFSVLLWTHFIGGWDAVLTY